MRSRVFWSRFSTRMSLYIAAFIFLSILFHRTRLCIFSWYESPSGAFYWGVASIWPLYHTGLISGLLQRWLLFWKVLLSPQRNAGALSEWPSGSWSPPWLRPFSLIAQFGQTSWRVLVVLNFSIYEWCSLGPSIQHNFFSVPFPRSVPRYNPVSEVYRQFLGLHVLVCALKCTVTGGHQ